MLAFTLQIQFCHVHHMLSSEFEVAAWSIYQGCPLSAFITEPIKDYILYGDLNKLSSDISEVPDYIVWHILKELGAISDLELSFAAGYTKPSVTFKRKILSIAFVFISHHPVGSS